MLPFLKKAKEVSPMVSTDEVTNSEEGGDDGKHAAMEEMIAAIHAKDAKALHTALSSYLEMHNSQNVEEGE
jgi:tRNA threonylcarbamoyladenosine modification (KEOPS) complex  Pcc1 subunit